SGRAAAQRRARVRTVPRRRAGRRTTRPRREAGAPAQLGLDRSRAGRRPHAPRARDGGGRGAGGETMMRAGIVWLCRVLVMVLVLGAFGHAFAASYPV